MPFLLSLFPVLSDGAQRRHARREAAERFSNTVGRVGGGGGGRGILAACTFPLDGRDAAPLMGNAKTHRESRETHPLVLSRATLAIRTVACLTVYRGPDSPAFEPSDLGNTVSLV